MNGLPYFTAHQEPRKPRTGFRRVLMRSDDRLRALTLDWRRSNTYPSHLVDCELAIPSPLPGAAAQVVRFSIAEADLGTLRNALLRLQGELVAVPKVDKVVTLDRRPGALGLDEWGES